MSVERVSVEPGVLVWARQAIGLDRVAAARKLGVSESTLNKWESGDLGPTVKQLRKMATVYHVPLAVLLLSEPPRAYQPIKDYRRKISGSTVPISSALHRELRRAEMQREVFLELSVLAPDSIVETIPLPELTLSTPPEEAGRLLREYVGVPIRTQHSWRSENEALNSWVAALEDKGILIIQTTHVPVDEARGFSLSEMPFPVIGLNGADGPRPRIFTLFHELSHIALNIGGLCDLHESKRSTNSRADQLEHFCNAAAVAAIVPSDDLLSSDTVAHNSIDHKWSLNELKIPANRYKISTEALLLRLITVGKSSWDLYWERKQELEAIYQEVLTNQKQYQQESGGGPSYYTVKARNIGHGYAHAVIDAYKSRAISSLDVSDYLQVKYGQIPKLKEVLR